MSRLLLFVAFVVTILSSAVPAAAESAPPGPALFFPSNGQENVDLPPVLMWNRLDDVVKYVWQATWNFEFGSPLWSGEVEQIADDLVWHEFQPGDVSPDMAVNWRVQGVYANGVTTEWSEIWTFHTQSDGLHAPDLISPADLAEDVALPPTIVWGSVEGAVSYDWQADYPGDFASPIAEGSVDAADALEFEHTFAAGEVNANSWVHWRVRSVDADGAAGPWSTIHVFKTGVAAAPSLVSPANGATNVALPARIVWRKVEGAVKYDYWAEGPTATGQSIWSGHVIATSDAEQSHTFSEAQVGPEREVQWTIRAVMEDGSTGPWSAVFTFHTASLAAATLVYPEHGASNISRTPTLKWRKTVGAVKYEVQARVNSTDFTSPSVSAEVIATTADEQTYTIPSGKIGDQQDVYWRVRAVGARDVAGPWSEAFKYHVGLLAPTLLAPANGATGVSMTPTLAWTRVPGAAKYVWLLAAGENSTSGEVVATTGSFFDFEGVTLPMGTVKAGQTVAWAVYAVTADGTNGPGTDFWTFTTVALPQVTRPAANETFMPGRIEAIRWSGGTAEKLDIFYLDDNTRISTSIAKNVAASAGSYEWTVSEELTCRKCRVVLRPAGDIHSTAEEKSALFAVQGLELSRVNEGGEKEYFSPDQHGWRFSNSADNLFPSSWWGQDRFNYNTGTDPLPQARYPADFAWTRQFPTSSSSFPDWHSYTGAYGSSAAYDQLIPGGRSIYNASFFNFWRRNHIAGGAWGGSCSGMASTALLLFHNPFALSTDIGSHEELYDYNPDLNSNSNARRLINAKAQYQPGKRHRDFADARWGRRPNETYVDVLLMLATETEDDDSWLYVGDRRGAHAIVPYKITDDSRNSRWQRVYVYDPNVPGATNLYVTFQTDTDSWTYNGFSPAMSGTGTGVYLMDPIANYGQNAIVTWSSAASKSEAEPAFVELYVGAATAVDIVGAGGTIGWADGEAYTSIEGAYPVIPAVGGPMHPTQYLLPNGSYGVTISDFPNESAYASIVADDVWYTYGRANAEGGEADRISIEGSGMTVGNSDGAAKVVTLEAFIPGAERTFVLTGVALGQADSLTFNVLDGSDLLVKNMGGVKTYTLELQQASSDGVSTVTKTQVMIGEGASHTIAPDWQNLDTTPVPVGIDTNGDGQVDDLMELSMNHAPDPAVIIEPAAGATIILAGDAAATVEVKWEAAADFDGDILAYRWELSETADFSTVLGSFEAGAATTVSANFSTLGDILKSAGVPVGGSVELYHRVIAFDGELETASEAMLVTVARGVITAVEDTELPKNVVLQQNYPNPFNPATVIRFGLPATSNVRLDVFDLLGRHVRTLIDGRHPAGWHEVVFEAGDLPSGVYMYRLTAGETVQVQRLTLSR